MEKNVLVELIDVSKVYKFKKVLNKINFKIHSGERIALLGGNGSGKSTLVEIIGKIREKTSGEIKYNPNLRVGFQFQESKYPNSITVKMVIDFYKDTFPDSSANSISDEHIQNLLKLFRLEVYLNKRISKLSGGEQQRLNILLALINSPNFLILDELSTGLDIKIKREVMEYITNYLNLNPECALILITHNPPEVKKMCNKLIILDNGNFVENREISTIEKEENLNLDEYLENVFNKLYKKDDKVYQIPDKMKYSSKSLFSKIFKKKGGK
ncbi:ABC transporter ATP-binding protein [Mesomycoplasma lagogenitalium]|uniref:ABC transporter ATP-binding protein n=1 Tax=Mesomycoplasma lagogenitalium TaxID=171286 RepID=A0ABY8LTN0_9BACT|nr:ABC transporter ATP-binding protein [Mesomycoplasma lagogenitalium]WGI36593.1 ABC transporter ATP-binding protein [Mesomycoplasma lagogenitalium]